MDVHLRVKHPLQGGLHHQPHQAVEIFDRRGLARKLTGELLGSRSYGSIHASVSNSEKGLSKLSFPCWLTQDYLQGRHGENAAAKQWASIACFQLVSKCVA
jgi:hypothetical protein